MLLTSGHVQVEIKKDIRNPLIESFQLVYVWVRSAEGGGVGPPGGVQVLGGGSPKSPGPFLRNFKYIVGILSSSPVDLHPFRAIWVKGGVCGHV